MTIFPGNESASVARVWRYKNLIITITITIKVEMWHTPATEHYVIFALLNARSIFVDSVLNEVGLICFWKWQSDVTGPRKR